MDEVCMDEPNENIVSDQKNFEENNLKNME